MAPFPLAVMAFAGVGVSYFNQVFTTTTRWAFLTLLVLMVLPQARILAGLRSGYGGILLVYFGWCLGTVMWSDVPDLSLLKSIALIATALAFIAGGCYWATALPLESALSYLVPMAFMTMVASLGGAGQKAIYSQGERLYQGLAGNPNFLGMLIAISVPWALHQIYRAFAHRKPMAVRLLACVPVGLLAIALMHSKSRASILCVLITLFFAAAAITTSKKLLLTAAIGLGSLAVLVVAPQVETRFYEQFVLKGSGEGGVFFSRIEPWTNSYRAALAGGYLGAGYGVSVGDSHFVFGLTAQTYGREKGNAQLAVWEETGLVGLVIYAMLLLALLREFYQGMRAAYDREHRFVLGVVLGTIVGMTVESAFEAWWVAPGSLESAAFWATVGVGTGLARQAMARKRTSPAVERADLVTARLLYGPRGAYMPDLQRRL